MRRIISRRVYLLLCQFAQPWNSPTTPQDESPIALPLDEAVEMRQRKTQRVGVSEDVWARIRACRDDFMGLGAMGFNVLLEEGKQGRCESVGRVDDEGSTDGSAGSVDKPVFAGDSSSGGYGCDGGVGVEGETEGFVESEDGVTEFGWMEICGAPFEGT